MRPHLFQHMAALSLLVILGCGSAPTIPTVEVLDLARFMVGGYVIASIPMVFEKNAFNAVEAYRRVKDGTVETTFRFNRGGFDGPAKV